jgi:hypothetical protein
VCENIFDLREMLRDTLHIMTAVKRKTSGLRRVLEGVEDEGGIGISDLVDGWGDRTCSEVDAIRWVAGNIRSRVTEVDAPSGVAWELLMLCRESLGFRVDFFKSLWTKLLPRQVEPDEKIDDGFDGMELVDVIEKLRGFGDDCGLAQSGRSPDS